MHLIRNSIDHGIETEQERKDSGKPETAKVILNAYQGGNQIIVEVIDDGRGLDYERIKKKVLEKGLATTETIANLNRSEIFDFIFAPGFSTAEKVTDISGRGVGMNVVREIVSELNGTITIDTEKGMGTTFNLAFPLTLAIIPAIMTKLSGDMYAVPLPDVSETIKIAEEDITTIEGHEVINLRGDILALLRLSDFVKAKSRRKQGEKIPVVVVQYGNKRIGLIVDDLQGKMEIVIKSLEQNYKTIEGLAGASILGDGSICLILDVANMVNKTLADFEKYSAQELQAMIDQTEANALSDAAIKVDLTQDDQEDFKFWDKQFDEEDAQKDADAESNAFEEDEDEEDYVPESPKASELKEEVEALVENMGEEPISSDDVEEEPDAEEEAPVENIDEEPIDSDYVEEKTEEPVESDDTEEPTEDMETGSSDDLTDDEHHAHIENKVKDALSDFRSELKENVKSALSAGHENESIYDELNISEDAMRLFASVTNVGAASAAESLSKILGKRIDLSIPDVMIVNIDDIPQKIGNVEEKHFGVYLPIMGGDIKGSLIFVLEETLTYEWLESLVGSQNKDHNNGTLTEDGFSALKEITNIVGAAILNVISEKIDMAIMPDVPVVIHDFMDKIFATQRLHNEYAIMMNTAFYFEDDQMIGNMVLLPETDSMMLITDRMLSQ